MRLASRSSAVGIIQCLTMNSRDDCSNQIDPHGLKLAAGEDEYGDREQQRCVQQAIQ